MLRRPNQPGVPLPPVVRQPEPPLNSQQTAQMSSLISELRTIQRAPRPEAVMIKQ